MIMTNRTTVLSALLFLPAVAAGAAPEDVAFARESGRIAVTIGGRPCATYIYADASILRPHFAHLHAPDGTQVSRNHPPVKGKDPADHATMHPGLWLAFGDLGGADFWRNKGRVEHEKFVEEPRDGPGRGTFSVVNRYVAGNRTVCRETFRCAVRVRPAGTLLILDSTFASDEADFHFGDQEEMGLGVRVATAIAVKSGGRIRDSEGRAGEKRVWGNTAAWCDYGGSIGGRHVGITLMPDPGNFRPAWFHARDYGLLVANPFGRKAFRKGKASRVEIGKGDRFRLRFGVLLHASAAGSAPDLNGAYADVLKVLEEARR
jgi:hypothetical protein